MSNNETKTLDRINGRYIWQEISSVLNLDKGIFYTIKELVIRPGRSVREFLLHDRNRLVKPIIFIIITSLIYTLVVNHFHIEEQYMQYGGFEDTTLAKMLSWIQHNYGYSNLMMGILIAFFIQIFFNEYDYNYYEILVLLCFVMGVAMLIFALFALLEGLFHVQLFALGGIVGFIYITYAIADFYDGTKVKNYFKAFTAYMLGMISFYILVFIVSFIVDWVK